MNKYIHFFNTYDQTGLESSAEIELYDFISDNINCTHDRYGNILMGGINNKSITTYKTILVVYIHLKYDTKPRVIIQRLPNAFGVSFNYTSSYFPVCFDLYSENYLDEFGDPQGYLYFPVCTSNGYIYTIKMTIKDLIEDLVWSESASKQYYYIYQEAAYPVDPSVFAIFDPYRVYIDNSQLLGSGGLKQIQWYYTFSFVWNDGTYLYYAPSLQTTAYTYPNGHTAISAPTGHNWANNLYPYFHIGYCYDLGESARKPFLFLLYRYIDSTEKGFGIAKYMFDDGNAWTLATVTSPDVNIRNYESTDYLNVVKNCIQFQIDKWYDLIICYYKVIDSDINLRQYRVMKLRGRQLTIVDDAPIKEAFISTFGVDGDGNYFYSTYTEMWKIPKARAADQKFVKNTDGTIKAFRFSMLGCNYNHSDSAGLQYSLIGACPTE